MNADWETQQEQLIRHAECLPELDVALKRRVLLAAGVAKKSSVRRRRMAIAASVLLFVSAGTFAVSRVVTGMYDGPVAESKRPAPDTQDNSDDGLLDQAVDRQQERAEIPASMFP